MRNETAGAIQEAPGEITQLLQRWDAKDGPDKERLLSLIQPELHRIATGRMRRERSDHTLQATALISELYVHLASREQVRFTNRSHFLAVASEAMRRILVDHARAKKAQKRGGELQPISLDGMDPGKKSDILDVLILNDLLEKLALKDSRMAKMVELRYFGGLTNLEIAEYLNVNERTVKRDWEVARSWLYGQLRKGGSDVSGRLGSGEGHI